MASLIFSMCPLITFLCRHRIIEELEAKLEYERVRREELEAQLDEYRAENSHLNIQVEELSGSLRQAEGVSGTRYIAAAVELRRWNNQPHFVTYCCVSRGTMASSTDCFKVDCNTSYSVYIRRFCGCRAYKSHLHTCRR